MPLRTGSLAIVLLLVCAWPAQAACPPRTQRQYFDSAQVVAKGRFLDGPTAANGRLLSPARFRVSKYIKGAGPRVVDVQTSETGDEGGPVGISVAVDPKPGERWRLPGRLTHGRAVLKTSTCDGAKRLHTR